MKTIAKSLVAGMLIVALALGGCGGDNAPSPAAFSGEVNNDDTNTTDRPPVNAPTLLKSALARDLAPAISDEEVAALVAGNTEFAWDFYKAWRGRAGLAGTNIVFSPYSLSAALAMTYAGARGETASQMANVLRFPVAADVVHRAFNALSLKLDAASQDAARMQIQNGIFIDDGKTLLASFLDVLAENYGAGAYVMDTKTAATAETSRQQINAWIAQATNNLVPELLPPERLRPGTSLVLTNTVYFKGAWAMPFSPMATTKAPFTLVDGSVVQIDMMAGGGGAKIKRDNQYVAVQVDYQGGAVSMVLVMPNPGQFDAVEQALLSRGAGDIVLSSIGELIVLRLPRFKFETAIGAAGLLKALGMRDAFESTSADFSGMDGAGGPAIEEVLHGAAIAVDEQGTEAAGATAVLVGMPSVPEILNVTFDRPFLFQIRDNATGTVLFAGRVMNPNE